MDAILKVLYEVFGGRSTRFAWVAFATGTALCAYGKIDGPAYVALVTLLTGIISARAVAQDRKINPSDHQSIG
jgi:hypothetical protein